MKKNISNILMTMYKNHFVKKKKKGMAFNINVASDLIKHC